MNRRILFIDIETSPNLGVFWNPGSKQSISPAQILQERFIINVSYKFAGWSKPRSLVADYRNWDDRDLLIKLTPILLEADEIVAHNGDRYDIKFINGRLAYHNLPPLGKLTSTDTLKMSRRAFFINSHRLDYLGKYFNLGRKGDGGGWTRVIDIIWHNKVKAVKEHIKYCNQDVDLMEDIYYHIRKYSDIGTHAGRQMGLSTSTCKSCGSDSHIGWGIYTSAAGIQYQKYKCKDCGYVGKYPKKIGK